MCCGESALCKEDKSEVLNDEHFARWIYKPRFVDEEGSLNHKFISLRERKGNPESGISGQIYERAGHDNVIKSGLEHRWTSNDGTDKEESFVGFAKAKVASIRGISDNESDCVDVKLKQSENIPFHAEIEFFIEGELMKGNTQNPRFLRYKDKLKDLFGQNIHKATDEDLVKAL